MQGRPEVAEHEVFISTLLLTVSVKDNENTSGLYWLSSEPQCSRLTALLRNETFKQSLFNHPSFLAALCACTEEKSSALLCMIISSEGCDILMEFLEGRPEVVESAEFISALVGQQLPLSENELVNAPPLYWLSINGYGYNVLSILYKNEVFKTKLFASDFFESLVLLSPKRRNMSIFYLLSSNIPRALPILRESILSKVFEAWILDPANVQKLMEALFIDPTSSNGVGKICNAFSLLLAKGEYGRAIIERLLDFSGIKKAILNRLSIPDEIEGFVLNVLKSDSGLLILNALLKSGRVGLLQTGSLQALFKHPQTQQLIRMQQIQPEWFLFNAVNQPHALEAAFFLEDVQISPWSINLSAHFLAQSIDGLVLDQSQKSRLKALVNKAFHCYSAERAEKMIWMRLAPRHNVFKENEASEGDDGNLSSKRMRFSAEEMSGAGREEENYQAKRGGQEDAGSAGEALVSERALALEIVLPPKRAIQAGEEIAEVDNAVIEEFNQCMEWIFSKEPLSDYHKAFTGLSNNRGDFRSKAHFSKGVGYLRRCLLPAMQKRIHQGKIPPCDPAHLNQLKACAAGVRHELGIITTRFEGQSPFQSYLDGAIRSNVNYYNRLFGIPSGLEVHALVPAVTSMMGMPFTGVPPYDAHLMNLSPRQYRWIAESVACALINNGERLREVLIMPIFNFFSQVLQNGAPGITLNGTQAQFDMAQMGPAHDFYVCLKLLNESTLLAKELDICEFLQKHLGLSELPQAEDILTIDTEMVINKFKLDLEMLFSSWYIKQQDIPQHKFIHFYSELLWRYLVDEESQELKIAIDNLLGKLPEAIDAGALIQYCLTSHSKERERLKLERLFKPISAQSHTSLCLILLRNPMLAFWLFGYEIIVTREQVNNVLQLKMEYNDTSHSAGLKADLLAFMRDERFLNTLEYALVEQGTLFFWLYYFQQNEIHASLFTAIHSFIFSTADYLFVYDSLLTVLYDMQASSNVSDEHKTLVRSFLEERLKQQLEHQHEAYWETACALFDKPEDLRRRVINDEIKYLWLSSTRKKHPLAVQYLFNGEPPQAHVLLRYRLLAPGASSSQNDPTNISYRA